MPTGILHLMPWKHCNFKTALLLLRRSDSATVLSLAWRLIPPLKPEECMLLNQTNSSQLCVCVFLSGGRLLEEGGERPQSGVGGADQACEWAGEQALKQGANLYSFFKEKTVLMSDCSETKGEDDWKKKYWNFIGFKLEFLWFAQSILFLKQKSYINICFQFEIKSSMFPKWCFDFSFFQIHPKHTF